MVDLVTVPFESLPAMGSLSPDAASLLPEGGSVADALKIMKRKGYAHESIPLLADAMPEREAVWWAAQSCEKAGPALAPADLKAAQAAAAWVEAPTAEAASAAQAAAAEAGFEGPGAFAAQAASMAQDPPVLAAGDALGTSLAKQTAAGSVQLAALAEAGMLPAAVPPEAVAAGAAAAGAVAVSQSSDDEHQGEAAAASEAPENEPPSKKDRKKASKASEPYVKMGQEVASGENHW